MKVCRVEYNIGIIYRIYIYVVSYDLLQLSYFCMMLRNRLELRKTDDNFAVNPFRAVIGGGTFWWL